jgi:hypothetical protein
MCYFQNFVMAPVRHAYVALFHNAPHNASQGDYVDEFVNKMLKR